ncbi:MAG: hypothetical protein IJ007_08055, partial [Oscillospiraceae bacterium]|nr:hypothetical protein [Oscillospiraceae bacterium]
MINEYGFFTSSNGDRKYTADDFCAFFGDFYTDGILAKDLNGFRTLPSGMMQLEITGGTAYIQGRWYRKAASQSLTVALSDTEYDRFDAVVIRCDFKQRLIYTDIVKGVPSAEPQLPSPERNEDIYELIIAYILVKADSCEITAADITDTRFSTELCGVVTNTIKSIDTSELFAQYQAAWNDFVAQLGESDNVTINTEDTESR